MTDLAAARRHLSARRWWSLIAAAWVATTTVGFIFTTWPSMLAGVLDLDCITMFSALVVLLALLVHGGWKRPLAYLGLKHFCAYPPVWVAGVMGAAGLICAVAAWRPLGLLMKVPEDNAALLLTVTWRAVIATLGGAMLSHLGVRLAAWCRIRRNLKRNDAEPIEAPQEGPKALLESWDKLHAWLMTDDAISKPTDDVFGYATKARRMVRRLSELPMPAQAIVGRLGTGKTTLRHLVEYELIRQHSRIHIVPVELWPYNTPEAAVEGVLRTLLDRVGEEVETLAIRGLPDEYRSAMGSSHAVGATLAGLLGKASNPFDLLEGLDRLALTVDHRFVVWIEDLERFAASRTHGETLESSLRLAPLRALLYGLASKQSVTVVTATPSLHARFDIDKIARYVERLPLLDATATSRAVDELRSRCLAFDVVVPGAAAARADWRNHDPEMTMAFSAAFGIKAHSTLTAVVALCQTPRTLKQALRRVLDFWRAHPGEIDFDDLLLMSVLREGEPTAYALIKDNWEDVAGVASKADVREKARATFEKKLKRLRLSEDRYLAVDKIIEEVFHKGQAYEKPQGLRELRYWDRFDSEPEILPEDSDQVVLRILLGDKDDPVLDLLERPQHAMVERFARMIPADRLLKLFEQLVLRRVPEDPRPWFVEGEWLTGRPPGMIPLWRMIGDQWRADRPASEAIAERLMRAFELSIGNLHLLHELEYFFCSPEEHGGPINRGGGQEGQALVAKARSRLWELLVDTFAGKPTLLVRGLRLTKPWALNYLTWGSLRLERKQTGAVPFPNWDQLAETIIEATRLEPTATLPNLAVLVSDSHSTFNGPKYTFNVDRARLLFGGEARVLELFRNPPGVAAEAEAVVSAVREAAAQHFAGQATPPAP